MSYLGANSMDVQGSFRLKLLIFVVGDCRDCICSIYSNSKVFITQTCPCNILQYFTAVKLIIFRRKIVIIFAQNIDRGYTFLANTHDLCFRAKIRKNIPL